MSFTIRALHETFFGFSSRCCRMTDKIIRMSRRRRLRRRRRKWEELEEAGEGQEKCCGAGDRSYELENKMSSLATLEHGVSQTCMPQNFTMNSGRSDQFNTEAALGARKIVKTYAGLWRDLPRYSKSGTLENTGPDEMGAHTSIF